MSYQPPPPLTTNQLQIHANADIDRRLALGDGSQPALELVTDMTDEAWVEYLTRSKEDSSTHTTHEHTVRAGRTYEVIRTYRYRLGPNEVERKVRLYSNEPYPDDVVLKINLFG